MARGSRSVQKEEYQHYPPQIKPVKRQKMQQSLRAGKQTLVLRAPTTKPRPRRGKQRAVVSQNLSGSALRRTCPFLSGTVWEAKQRAAQQLKAAQPVATSQPWNDESCSATATARRETRRCPGLSGEVAEWQYTRINGELGINKVKVKSCPTLCDPVDPPGSSVHGILQARIPEWVAISFSRGSSRPRDRTQFSHIAGRHTSEPPGKPNTQTCNSSSNPVN